MIIIISEHKLFGYNLCIIATVNKFIGDFRIITWSIIENIIVIFIKLVY